MNPGIGGITLKDLDVSELEACINSLGEKFLKYPYNFFTESDAHSFLFYYLFRYGTRDYKTVVPLKSCTSRLSKTESV